MASCYRLHQVLQILRLVVYPTGPLGEVESRPAFAYLYFAFWFSSFSAILVCCRIIPDTPPLVNDMFRGPGRTTLYNETFIPLAGKSHPHIIGLPVREVFPDIGDTVVGILENAEKTGLAGDIHEIPLLLERDGFVEESFFTGNFIPLRGDTGKVEGFYSAIVETTREKLDSRRKTMLHSMSIPSGLHTDDLSSCVIPFLEQNALDIPMALLYQSDEETLPGTCLLHLRGQLGVPENHPLAVEQADLNSLAGLIPFLRKAESQIMTFPVDEKFEGIQWRGFLEPSPFFSVLPLRGAGRRFGFLVLGSNCHRPIDADFDQFMQEIASRVSAIAASIQSADEDRKRAERLERELADREKQIRYMAEHASVGMQHLGIDGQTLWSNKQYCDLTGHPRPHEEQYKFSFLDVLIEEDRGKALDSWSRLLQGEKNVTTELRLKRMFTPPSGDPEVSDQFHSFDGEGMLIYFGIRVFKVSQSCPPPALQFSNTNFHFLNNSMSACSHLHFHIVRMGKLNPLWLAILIFHY